MTESTSVTSLARLALNKGAERRLRRGHLWIYSNEVDVAATPLKQFVAGDQVQVFSAQGESLGVAMLSPNNLLCGRIVNRFSDAPFGEQLLRARIEGALRLRQRLYTEPFYRVVYGDSDGLPGLVVDRFGDYLVAQINSAGMERLQPQVIAALVQVLQPRGVLLRNDSGAREQDGLEKSIVLAWGEMPEFIDVLENGCCLQISPWTGQKTGWFYDHRENRAWLQRWIRGGKQRDARPPCRVLDVFSYVGGWALQAAIAGADEVLAVDASQDALDLLCAGAARNNVADRVQVEKGKAIAVLKNLTEAGRRFDVIVLDPPAFIKRRKDQREGEKAYRHINELALKLLANDGLLVSASCSMHLSGEQLLDIVSGAANHQRRELQLLYSGGQGPDHPRHPAIPETDYLKALFFAVA